MRAEPLELPEVLLLHGVVHGDARGSFREIWRQDVYRALGLAHDFVQDNVSVSEAGVLRGLHLQNPDSQGRLISVLAGRVFDVAVDVRAGSPTFGRWVGVTLDAVSGRQLYIPPGFAHGFMVLEGPCVFHYRCTAYYAPEHEYIVRWSDPDIGIAWPAEPTRVSAKDTVAPLLRDIPAEQLPVWSGGSPQGAIESA